MQFFIDLFRNEQKRWRLNDQSVSLNNFVDRTIKWTSELEAHLMKGTTLSFDESHSRNILHRPFVKMKGYVSRVMIHRLYQQPDIFGMAKQTDNVVISINYGTPQFSCLASDCVFDYALLKFGNGSTQCMPLYRYDKQGNRVDNITDWALTQFRTHYAAPVAVSFRGVFDEESRTSPPANASGILRSQSLAQNDISNASRNTHHAPLITKQSIFHYVYAVMHHPAYRQKYELNLKREFPRIPFYDDFWQWATWGQALMELHLNYETVDSYPLQRHETDPATSRTAYKAKLKADKAQGIIELDTLTSLSGVPPSAWEYKLGNRSALEWILDRYKESTPKDPTIREKFNTYRFRDYKEQVIDLLMRVTTVSLRTVEITQAMGA